MGVNKGNRERLAGVVELIVTASREGRYHVSTEAIGDALGVESVELYRALYADPRGVTFSEAIDGFSEERVGELVTFLETLGYGEAEETLYRAGLFLPYEAGNRLTETFVSRYARALAEHDVDRDELDYYFRRGATYGEAARRYLATELPVEPIAAESAALFMEREGLPGRAMHTVRRYLRMLMERRVLEYEVIGAPFYDTAYRFGVRRGYINPRQEEGFYGSGAGAREGRRRSSSAGAPDFGDLLWARKRLGVGEGASRSDIRRAYRHRMLQFHPDVNPRGTEVAKELNRAYATLLAGTADSR